MKKTVNKVLLPHKYKKLVLSVSGGVDSLVLFHILKDLNYNFVVAHFNHQVRKESEDEAIYLQKLCKKNNIEFEYELISIDDNQNFQSKAHKLRKDHLINIASKYKTDVIITAHHLNDLAETVLIKLSRGSNLLGYSGTQKTYYKNNFHFLKPLLHISKKEILLYAKNNNIFFFEDYTNKLDDYTRNKIRNHVIPYLIDENPAFLTKIIQFNNTLSESFHFIRKTSIEFLNNNNFFSVNNFKNIEEAVQKDVISYLLENLDVSLTSNKINDILFFILSSGPNKSLDIGDNYEVRINYNKVYFQEKYIKKDFKLQLDLEKPNLLSDGRFIILNNNLDNLAKNDTILCYNRLVLPLWARNRRNGDKLYFSYGHKKLKDFYIDKKVPLEERDKDIIITDNNDQILAVIGRYVNENPTLKDKIKITVRGKDEKNIT